MKHSKDLYGHALGHPPGIASALIPRGDSYIQVIGGEKGYIQLNHVQSLMTKYAAHMEVRRVCIILVYSSL